MQRKIRNRVTDENILKALYQMGEKDQSSAEFRTMDHILSWRRFRKDLLISGLQRLRRQGFLISRKTAWALTEEGLLKGRRMVKLHRLWEVYLTQYVQIAPDHVHEDAESIEHILTPELEAKLEKLLQYPEKDPHHSQIPYTN